MSHTKEPWAYHTRGNYGAGEEADLSVEKLDSARGYLGLDDARRIVACVNTCAGISTESLEQGGVGSILSLGLSELKRGDVAEKQRDELLAAAEAIEINAEECMDFDDCMAILVPIDDYHKLIEAIDTVKGGA